MNKLKTFWYVFKNSLTNFTYYMQILKVPITFSLKYLYVLVYFVIFIQVAIFAVQAAILLPQLPQALRTVETRLNNLYPNNLVITINNGVLSTNVEEPFFIDIPELEVSEEFTHLVTIDTEASVEAYIDYKTFFLVTDTEIVYPESSYGDISRYQVLSVKDIEQNLTITRETYNTFAAEIISFFPLLQRLAPYILLLGAFLLPVIIALFVTMGHLILLVFLSVITWTIATIFRIRISYLKSLQLGMHGFTFPILLQLAITLSGNTFPMVFISGFIFWMVLVLSQMQQVRAE